MPKLDDLVEFLEQRFESSIRARQILPPSPGETRPFPDGLDARLRAVLEAEGIRSLYAHQAEAFGPIAANQDTVLVARTASGKTLSFMLPILSEYAAAPTPFTALFLYPTKALSRDQESTLGRLLHAALEHRKLGTFDGDTPREARQAIQQAADFVITNPDMLHAGILPNHHRGWRNFLARLRYVVVDEVHTYRGAFGSHVANVMRRLLRVCAMHGSRPAFVCASATVGNPGEHVRALFGREFRVIDGDGSPRPRRDLYFVNPPMVQSHGAAQYRKGPSAVTTPLLRQAAALNLRTICFCRARQEVERLYHRVTDGHPHLRDRIQPYRGGLLPDERRRLERDLFEGRLTAIITTNALELGIDIGDLDLCLLSGHPGTVASFWQQAGRVGRRGDRSVIVFVARDTPIDQYLTNHPDFITATPVEQAWLNADNPYIMLQHLPCAAHEHPLGDTEPGFDPALYRPVLRALADDGTLKPWQGAWRYALRDYPARGVNLRGLTDFNVDIYCGTEVIGEIDPIGARGTLYKDAIYQHLGRKYMSMDLDLDQKLCRVEPVEVDYYTEAVWENRIEMIHPDAEAERHGARLAFGEVRVNKQPKLYKKIRERSFENVGYGPITLAPFEYDTSGLSLHLPPAWKEAADAADLRYRDAALYGLSYLLRRVAPSLCMADANDIETDVARSEAGPALWRSALFLYDTIEGGVGYAEKIFERIADAFALCLRVIDECPCPSGCPSCVPPLPPGIEDEELEAFLIESDAAVRCARSLLVALSEGVVEVPVVTVLRHPRGAGVVAPPVDEEAQRLETRVGRAAGILRRKREREH